MLLPNLTSASPCTVGVRSPPDAGLLLSSDWKWRAQLNSWLSSERNVCPSGHNTQHGQSSSSCRNCVASGLISHSHVTQRQPTIRLCSGPDVVHISMLTSASFGFLPDWQMSRDMFEECPFRNFMEMTKLGTMSELAFRTLDGNTCSINCRAHSSAVEWRVALYKKK